MPADVGSMSIWSMVDPCNGRTPKKQDFSEYRGTTKSIFRECQGQRVRKRVTARVRNSYGGSIVMGVRVGEHTTCVCKCKVV